MVATKLALVGATAALASLVKAQDTPLASKHFTYTALPYMADTSTTARGTQQGYNICNSTTENQNSMCQTSMVNSIDDFCLWAPPAPNSLVADTEGEMVAWCTKAGRGTRIIPQGALTGVQFMKTPAYVQVTGHINQSLINLQADDTGGEMDPHGADGRGNPIGGLVFSNAWGQENGQTFVQAVEWHNFMGGNIFCIKACDPANPNAANFCQHVFDRIGCAYNAPAAYQDNVFESCQGDNQDFPGVYTVNGQVMTYQQPAESLGPISSIPYQPRIPASSACTPFTSSAIYTAGNALASASASNASVVSASIARTASHSSSSVASSAASSAASSSGSGSSAGSAAAASGSAKAGAAVRSSDITGQALFAGVALAVVGLVPVFML